MLGFCCCCLCCSQLIIWEPCTCICLNLRVLYMHMKKTCYDDLMICTCNFPQHLLVEYVCCRRYKICQFEPILLGHLTILMLNMFVPQHLLSLFFWESWLFCLCSVYMLLCIYPVFSLKRILCDSSFTCLNMVILSPFQYFYDNVMLCIHSCASLYCDNLLLNLGLV